MKPKLVRDNIPLIMIQEGKKAFIKDVFTYAAYLMDYQSVRDSFAWEQISNNFMKIHSSRSHDEKVLILVEIIELTECFFDAKIMNCINVERPIMLAKRISDVIKEHNISMGEIIRVKAEERLEKGSFKKEYLLIDVYES